MKPQKSAQSGNRKATMADRVLLAPWNLGHGQAPLRKNENRIEPGTGFPGGGDSNQALHDTFEGCVVSGCIEEHQGASEPGGTFF